jgi:hypothetical protein
LCSTPQALIFKLRGVSVEEELGPDESWISPVDVNLVKIKLMLRFEPKEIVKRVSTLLSILKLAK